MKIIIVAFITWLVFVLVATMEKHQWSSVRKWLIGLKNGLILNLDLILYPPNPMLSTELSRSLSSNLNATKEGNTVAKDIKIYRYSRGEIYQCQVRIVEGLVVFDKVVAPPSTTAEVLSKLMDDAEREALKLHSKEG